LFCTLLRRWVSQRWAVPGPGVPRKYVKVFGAGAAGSRDCWSPHRLLSACGRWGEWYCAAVGSCAVVTLPPSPLWLLVAVVLCRPSVPPAVPEGLAAAVRQCTEFHCPVCRLQLCVVAAPGKVSAAVSTTTELAAAAEPALQQQQQQRWRLQVAGGPGTGRQLP